MTVLRTGLVSLLVFGAVILVHELGHFLAARHCGIHVEEFSIGFGPKIFQRRRGSTTYTLRLFPLGGYNLFSPLPEDNEDADAEETAAPAPQPAPKQSRRRSLFPVVVQDQPFEEATAWQRFIVTLSGAMMNFVLGFVVLLVLVITGGKLGSTTVAQFTDNAQSCADGLREGDTILKVDGQVCRTIGDLSGCFDGTTQTHDFTVLRNGQVVHLPGVTVGPSTDADGNHATASCEITVKGLTSVSFKVNGQMEDLSCGKIGVLPGVSAVSGLYVADEQRREVDAEQLFREATENTCSSPRSFACAPAEADNGEDICLIGKQTNGSTNAATP